MMVLDCTGMYLGASYVIRLSNWTRYIYLWTTVIYSLIPKLKRLIIHYFDTRAYIFLRPLFLSWVRREWIFNKAEGSWYPSCRLLGSSTPTMAKCEIASNLPRKKRYVVTLLLAVLVLNDWISMKTTFLLAMKVNRWCTAPIVILLRWEWTFLVGLRI